MKRSLVTNLKILSAAFLVLAAESSVNCQTTATLVAGPAAEAGVEGVVDHLPANTILDALAMTAVGGNSGAMISQLMDKEAAELKASLKNVKVERVGEGILITLETKTIFESDSYALASTKTLKEVAKALKKYKDTNALIEGHTDNTGEESYNQRLSENRAAEVENYFITQGIADARMKVKGYGEKQPLASNDTEIGKLTNRRLEIAIFANDDMKARASKGDLGVFVASKK